MDHIIAKAINTVNRRLRVGDLVSAADELAPHSFDVLKARGFIAEKSPVVAPAVAAPRASKGDTA